MINTGDWTVSAAADSAIKRACGRAISRSTNIVSQEDLFVAILQSPGEETDEIVYAVPRLRVLRTSLAESDERLEVLTVKASTVDFFASGPLQTSIELTAQEGSVTAASLLRGLMRNPKTALLKLLAAEYEMNRLS